MSKFNDDLHELTESEYCDDVVKKGLSIEFDVALYLIETSKNIPHLGSAIKLFQVGTYIYEFKRYYWCPIIYYTSAPEHFKLYEIRGV